MHFVGILNSGWVILKEKSISQIIMHRRIMWHKTKHQTIFSKSMKECLISRLAKHTLLIARAKEQISANICQKYCLKWSYWPPEGGLGLKSSDHLQVRFLESALIEDRSWNWEWERNKFWEARLTLDMTFCQQRITFSHTDAGVSAKKRKRWPTNVGERGLYTCLSRPLKSAIFCHFEWQLDQFQNWKCLPTLWASECYILFYNLITGIGFMNKMIPNFREKTELLTFLLIWANIGKFLTHFNHGHKKCILLASVWVYFQM